MVATGFKILGVRGCSCDIILGSTTSLQYPASPDIDLHVFVLYSHEESLVFRSNTSESNRHPRSLGILTSSDGFCTEAPRLNEITGKSAAMRDCSQLSTWPTI